MGVNVAAYLARLGVDDRADMSVEGLERLQRAHLTRVPFENLDVFHARGVATDASWSVPKIVDRGRGGWCYEVNGAFATLLDALGFSVKWLGATVLPADSPGPDHLAVEVTLDRPYLVDVGFGDSFICPLPLDSEGPHDGGTGLYRFEFGDDTTTLLFDGPDESEAQYRFGDQPFTAADFVAPSERLQTSRDSKWTKSPFATRLLSGGPDRVILLEDRIKFRRNGRWTEHPVSTDDEWAQLLDEWFNLTP